MNRKQLVILLVLVVLFGSAGLVVYKNQRSARSSGNLGIGKKLMGEFPVNDVTTITIQHGTNAVSLYKRDDLWRVKERNDYPANFSQISDFLIKLRDLKVVQSEAVGPSQMARLELTPGQGTNAATVVDFQGQNGKTINTLLLGKMHLNSGGASPMGEEGGWPDGRYVKVGLNATEAAVISNPFENIEPKPEAWLNKDFIHVEKPRSIEVNFPVATNSCKLTRETETGEWKLADAKADEQLDSSKTSSLSSLLSSATFTDVLPGHQVTGTGTNQPTEVKIQTFDGFNYVIHVGSKTNDDYPITVAVDAQLPKERTPGADEKPEDKAKLDKEFADQHAKLTDKLKQEQAFNDWTFLVSSWTMEPALKERSQLLVEKKSEANETGGSGTNAVNLAEEPKLENPTLPAIQKAPDSQ